MRTLRSLDLTGNGGNCIPRTLSVDLRSIQSSFRESLGVLESLFNAIYEI